MRVADKQLYSQHVRRLGVQRNNQIKLQEQAVTGKRINRPSDDPGTFGRLSRLERKVASLEGMMRNVDVARPPLDTADDVLDAVGDALIRSRELTMQGLNGAMSPSDRQAIAHEVRSLRDHVVELAGTQVEGRYVFSGTRTDLPPLDELGGYQGGGQGALVEVGEGLTVDMAVDGRAIFDGDVRIVAMLDELAEALENNDLDGIGPKLEEIDRAEEQILDGRSELGARLSRIDLAQNLTESIHFQLLTEKRDVGDADMAQVISGMAAQEQALQIAVQVAGKSLRPSLMDVL